MMLTTVGKRGQMKTKFEIEREKRILIEQHNEVTDTTVRSIIRHRIETLNWVLGVDDK